MKLLLTFLLGSVVSALYALPGPTGSSPSSSNPTAPELSTGAIYSGLTILIGTSLIAADWIRKNRQN